MSDINVLEVIANIVNPYGLEVEFLGSGFSVGVGGDNRTYTRIIVLSGPHPGNETLALLSTKISNLTHINRVTFQTGAR